MSFQDFWSKRNDPKVAEGHYTAICQYVDWKMTESGKEVFEIRWLIQELGDKPIDQTIFLNSEMASQNIQSLTYKWDDFNKTSLESIDDAGQVLTTLQRGLKGAVAKIKVFHSTSKQTGKIYTNVAISEFISTGLNEPIEPVTPF